ncbi:hypothetical protein GGI12_001112 [Dipsacomyces acuminosporus]|nr:hypothetical protein GGI12_001112 [Dipsacomyces acuminosporus]
MDTSKDSEGRAAVESVADQHTVYEIHDTGVVIPQPALDAQQEMTKQITQLWDTYTNFQGLSDFDDDEEEGEEENEEVASSPTSDAEESQAKQPAAAAAAAAAASKEATENAELDALAVRASVYEKLLHAQSEIMVALDVVQLLLAAEKQVYTQSLQAASGSGSSLMQKHDQPSLPAGGILDASKSTAAEAAGNMPLPVGVLGTTKTGKPQEQEQQKIDRTKFVLGAKQQQLGEAASMLESGAKRLSSVVDRESGFWRSAFQLRDRNWVVQQHRQLLQIRGNRRIPLFGDRYFIRYGYADSGSTFSEDGVAELLRSDSGDNDNKAHNSQEGVEGDMDVDTPENTQDSSNDPAHLILPGNDTRTLGVRIFSTRRQDNPGFTNGFGRHSYTAGDESSQQKQQSFLDRAHAKLLRARKAMFDRELYYRLCKEARVLELGSVRSVVKPASTNGGDGGDGDDGEQTMRDALLVTLSRDNVAIRLEWALDDHDTTADGADSERAAMTLRQWQGEYCSGLALVMAAMYQRKLHKEVKKYFLGSGLSSKSLVPSSNVVAVGNQIPDAFAIVSSSSSATQGQGSGPAGGPTATPGSNSGGNGPTSSSAGGAQGSSSSAAASSGSGAGPAGAGGGSGNGAAGAGVSGLPSASAGGSAAGGSGSDAAGIHSTTTYAVAKPELLVLSPVLQNVQFARWQNIISLNVQRACAAWRKLVEEPIEVVTHFAIIYSTPHTLREGSKLSELEMNEFKQFASGKKNTMNLSTAIFGSKDYDGLAFVVRMRFQGGTVIAYRIDSNGNLLSAKGYFPPDVPHSHSPASAEGGDRNINDQCPALGSRPEQAYINRVSKIVPLNGISEFVDQLKRELQSLALLRVAAALSRCSYQRDGKKCQMGYWYVHQSQLCVVGEWLEGVRHRQIIGVAKWSSTTHASDTSSSGDLAEKLDYDNDDWDLCLYFGPKHPTVFDIPGDLAKVAPRIPWITCFPLPKDHRLASQVARMKTFEEKLFKAIVETA